MMKNNEEIKERIEREFYALKERGEDLRCFLYFPYEMLTTEIKNHLDEILIKDAYNKIQSGEITPSDFLVYEDKLITVRLDKKDKQLELLNKMIEYFTKNEEYEKCAIVQIMINTINHGRN